MQTNFDKQVYSIAERIRDTLSGDLQSTIETCESAFADLKIAENAQLDSYLKEIFTTPLCEPLKINALSKVYLEQERENEVVEVIERFKSEFIEENCPHNPIHSTCCEVARASAKKIYKAINLDVKSVNRIERQIVEKVFEYVNTKQITEVTGPVHCVYIMDTVGKMTKYVANVSNLAVEAIAPTNEEKAAVLSQDYNTLNSIAEGNNLWILNSPTKTIEHKLLAIGFLAILATREHMLGTARMLSAFSGVKPDDE